MHANQMPRAFSRRTVKHIQLTARRLARLPGFSRSDIPDIEQDLALAAWKALPRFDPSHASIDTFVDRVLGAVVGMLERRRERQKRDHRREAYSIDEMMDAKRAAEAEGGDAVPPLEAEVHDLRLGRDYADEAHRAGLRLDVAQILERLPADLRAVAEMLMDGQSLVQVARALGIPRQTLQGREMAALRHAFRDFGDFAKSLGSTAAHGTSD